MILRMSLSLLSASTGGEVVDVEMENFVAHGFEHRVVELEERELRAAASVVGVIVFRRCRKHLSVVGIVCLELVENGFGALHNTVGHTGQTRHMNTERVFRPPRASLRRKTMRDLLRAQRHCSS